VAAKNFPWMGSAKKRSSVEEEIKWLCCECGYVMSVAYTEFLQATDKH